MLACTKMGSRTPVVLLACGSFNPVTCMHLRLFDLARDFLNKEGRSYVIGGIISPVSDAYQKAEMIPTKHRCAMIRSSIQNMDWVRLSTWETERPVWTETVKVLEYHGENYENILGNPTNPVPFYHAMRTAAAQGQSDSGFVEQNGDLPAKTDKNGHENGLKHVDFELEIEDDEQRRLLRTDRVRVSGVPRVLLLCGADLLQSFATPNLWKKEDLRRISQDFGIVCVTRHNYNPDKFVYEHETLNQNEFNIRIVREWVVNEISATKIRRSVRRGVSIRYLVPDGVYKYIKEHQLYLADDSEVESSKK